MEILKAMEHAPLPLDEVIYEPSIEELEGLKIADEMKERAYGGLEIQIGYCNGNNKKLNAVEYHRSSELDIAVDDLILLLGCCTSERYEYRTDRSAEKTIEEAKKAEGKMPEDGLLTAKNKWLIAHEEAEIEGAFNGLCGVNVTV